LSGAACCREVTRTAAKKDCSRTETPVTAGQNVKIVDKSHNQTDPISGHVGDIRLRSSRLDRQRTTGDCSGAGLLLLLM